MDCLLHDDSALFLFPLFYSLILSLSLLRRMSLPHSDSNGFDKDSKTAWDTPVADGLRESIDEPL